MATRRRVWFTATAVLWTAVATTLLVAARVFSLELLFIVAFVGLLISAGMTSSKTVSVPWRTRVRGFVVAGFVVFVGIVVTRILQLLP